MRNSIDPNLRRWTLPLAVVFSVLLPLLLPENGRLENALNRALPSPLDSRLVLIGIDDASLRDYGRMELWPRELYAAAFNTLEEAGVKAVGLDVLLSAPSARDAQVGNTFDQPHLVLATAPGDVLSPFPQEWSSPTGVSALNVPSFGGVREVQTAYPTTGLNSVGTGQLVPSFARQVAAQVAPPLPLDTQRHLIRYTTPQEISARTLPFRDVVNGHVRFSQLQGKVAVIGLIANGLGNISLPDADRTPVPGTVLQLRAISSLLAAPLTRLPLPLTMLACLLAAGLAMWWGGLGGFVIAGAALLLTLPLWLLNIVFPGVTVSLAALVGAGLVAFEQWWRARRVVTHDHLTGFGNRLAFTRAVEQRWRGRADRPVGLLLIDLDNLRQVRELHGRLAGEQALKAVAARLQEHKRRGDLTFRWGTEEFAVLLDQHTSHSIVNQSNAGQATPGQSLAGAIDHYYQGLQGVDVNGSSLQVNVGGAVTGLDIATPTELIDAASRSRYRMKYQRELQGQPPQVNGKPEP